MTVSHGAQYRAQRSSRFAFSVAGVNEDESLSFA
jgi:hypothetical protein